MDKYLTEIAVIESAYSSDVIHEPTSMSEAMNSEDPPKWREAAETEMALLNEHNMWDLCDLPEGRKAVGSKWVFKIKYSEDGSVSRYKARVVAQGYSQAPGVDYNETFTPVAASEQFEDYW